MSLKKTAFYEIHQQLGAKLVEFAGYLMPVQYAGIKQEHKRVRSTVGLFDVSHMGEFIIRGDNALAFLQHMTINDVSKLAVDQVQYSAMCYENGGLVDDLLVYRLADHYMVVVNAANLDKDWAWMQKHLTPEVELINRTDELSLLALQGPQAEPTLAKLTDLHLNDIPYYWLKVGNVSGVEMIVSRTGYTGEPGFELCFSVAHSEMIWQALMQAGAEFHIEPIGLGARDTLRLEMKYCLYGHDIDETTNPLEAGLGWITRLDKGDFIGKSAIQKVKEHGPTRKLVGFEMIEEAFPRQGYIIWQGERELGHVTSGTYSPMLEKGIGTGYVAADVATVGADIQIDVRGKKVAARIVKTPFYHKNSTHG
ncbi:glycine cleavage system aminomethyltransferase GcvT [candidate division KSB1 bacterium]|nr:glycine cleavage system aminomethyltransferase GcvT [candidate division KSB1 bacterium]